MSTAPSGYSGTPLPQKLGFKPGMRAALIGAPGDFAATLGALPEGVEVTWSRLKLVIRKELR
jgi:hypothetical protein